MHYIYKITNKINNKIYIGQTKNMSRRWACYKSSVKSDKEYAKSHIIISAMKKYGIENFIIEIIDFGLNVWQTDCLEINIINKYNTRNIEIGYNVALGGAVARGWHHTLKHKEKMHKLFLGRVMSKESRKKLSDVKKGKTSSVFGKHWTHSEEHNKQKSERMKNKTWKIINGVRVYSEK